MIDFILNDASTPQFVLVLFLIVTGTMIGLQLIVRRSVWSPYVIAFLASAVTLLVTLR